MATSTPNDDQPCPTQLEPAPYRTPLAASACSDVDDLDPEPAARTAPRKRFSDRQVSMLEDLYHRTSHPSRVAREALAAELEMYVPRPPAASPPWPPQPITI
jgi:hypothetical protein